MDLFFELMFYWACDYLFYHIPWNSLVCKMIDYLKASIVQFKLNFENA